MSQLGFVVFATLMLFAPRVAADDETPLFGGRREPLQTVSVMRSLQGADMNGDGLHDLVTSDSGLNSVSVMLGLGDGRFGPLLSTSVAVDPLRMALGDVNADGRLDVAVDQDDEVGVLLGVGDGSLAAPLSVAAGADVGGLALGDLDGDGDADLAVLRTTTDRLSTHVSDGAGGFTTGNARILSPDARTLRLADVNEDGDLDAVVTHYNRAPGFSVLLGNGNGNLAAATFTPAVDGLVPLSVRDWNADGHLDLATAGGFSGSPTGLLELDGAGDGTFAAPVVVGDSYGASDFIEGDFDRDGVDDLVSVASSIQQLTVFLGSPSGLTEVDSWSADNTEHVTSLDADGDGALDLVLESWGTLSTPSSLDHVDIHRGRGDGTFQRARTAGPGHSNAFILADFEGDGDVDLWTRPLFTSDLQAWENDGSGNYSLVATTPGVGGELVTDDIDNDGEADLVVLDTLADEVNVYLGAGDGSVGLVSTLAVSADAHLIALGEADSPHVDLFVLDETFFTGTLSVHMGAGDGTFGAAVTTALPPEANDLFLAHLDTDGVLDAAITAGDFSDRRVQAWHGQGDGTFALAGETTVSGNQLLQVLVDDLDHDTIPDAVAIRGYSAVDDDGSKEVYVLPGLAGGTFGAATQIDEIEEPDYVPQFQGARLVDVDLDGHVDLVTMSEPRTALELRRGNGTLGFDPVDTHRYRVNGGDGLDVADVNGDGLPDVVTATPDGVQVVEQQREDAWVGLGRALGGVHGEPSVLGTGTLAGNTPFTISVAGSVPFGTAWLILGFFDISVPFKGGVLVPDPTPPAGILVLPLDAVGGVAFTLTWPPGAPAGAEILWQAWVPDPSGPFGFTATNAIVGTTP